ncbi:MAG: VWA domain-containing protein [Deltaproteobacteria bacterium]|nr:VWA domain-containing protein [Deltaproteobacteria bacterium]
MRRFFGLFFMLSVLFSFLVFSVHASTAKYPEVMIILDGSGSMWGKAAGEAKISAAKKVLKELVPSLPEEVKLGLTVYGHRQKGNCDDIEIIIPPGSDDRTLLLEKVDAITPKGKTPIADSIKRVVDALKSRENETTIILVSDGLETCNPDPCGVVKALKKTGIKFILHVVGFDVSSDEKEQLSCLAKAGGGTYYSAGNAGDLLAAFKSMQQEVVKKVEYEKAKTTGKKAKSRLGKLKVTFPQSGKKSLAQIRIIRKKDNKTIKTAESPKAESIHPLLAGEYEVIMGYANSNYQKPTEISAIPVTITGGETTNLELGVLVFNVADSLKKIPASSVILHGEDEKIVLKTPASGNDYFFFTPKPLPSGIYTFEYHYKTMPGPAILARGLEIKANEET